MISLIVLILNTTMVKLTSLFNMNIYLSISKMGFTRKTKVELKERFTGVPSQGDINKML